MSQLPSKAPQSSGLKILPTARVVLLDDLTPYAPASAHLEPRPAFAWHFHTFQLVPIAPCQKFAEPTPSLSYPSPAHLTVSQVSAAMKLSVFLFQDFPSLLFPAYPA